MIRSQAKEVLQDLLNERKMVSEEEDDIVLALEFAIADMDVLQDVLNCVSLIIKE